MKITVNNYESFFLDYHEGTLSAEDSAELFLFLESHPEFKEEFESFENISLSDESFILYPDKQSLKKNEAPTIETIDEWLIAELEGDLTLQQRTLLIAFLAQYPQYQADRGLFRSSVLHADTKEVFPAKASLLKPVIGKPVSINRYWYALAASLILLLGAWITFRISHPDTTPETAGNEKDKNTVIDTVVNRNDASSAPKEKFVAETIKDSAVSTPSIKDNSSTAEEEKNLAQHNASDKIQKINADKVNATEKEFTAENKKQKSSSKRPAVIIIDTEREDMALINPRLTAGLTEESPFVFAERRYTPPVDFNHLQKENLTAEQIQGKVIGEIKDFAANNVNKAAGEQVLATTENTPKLPFKSRLIRLAGSVISKISGNQVKVKTSFDPINGNFAAYEVELGKNKWQKQF